MNSLIKSWRNIIPVAFILLVCGGLYFLFDDLRFLLSPKQDVTVASQDDRVVQMVSVLSRDAIRSIDRPQFISADRANYTPDELVIGVEVEGEARAYSIPYLSRYEIVNDELQGVHLAVTW